MSNLLVHVFQRYKPLLIALSILFISALLLSPTLFNDWVNWDDPAYVTENSLIQNLNTDSILKIFKTTEVQGIYHPITLISLAIDYSYWGLDPFGFHLSNLIFHLLNTLLVFFIFLRMNSSLLVAGLVALLFGIHPMHVESVAWISARKDVLYAFFFFLSIFSYLRYRSALKSRRFIWYAISLILFLFALLSKSIAFTLPIVFILIDFYFDRRKILRHLGDKIPFILLSIIALTVAINGQQSSDSMSAISATSIDKTLFISTYNTVFYIFKGIIPINLAAFHPFSIPLSPTPLQYLSIVPFLIILIVLYYSYRKSTNVFFGLAFYLVSIAPLTQLIPFGKAINSERYTYVAYIGLFYCGAILIQKLLRSDRKMLKIGTLGITSVWLILISLQSFNQSKKWKNSEILWSQVIDLYPKSEWAYMSRSLYYSKHDKYQKALEDLNKSIDIRPFAQSLYQRGLILEKTSFEKALNDYRQSIEIDPGYAKSHLNIGVIQAKLGHYEESIQSFQRAIDADPKYSLAYFNYATALKILNRKNEALTNYNEAINLEPYNTNYRKYRAALLTELNRAEEAINDINYVISITPNDGNIYYLRSLNYRNLNLYSQAKKDAIHAQQLGYELQEGYLNTLK